MGYRYDELAEALDKPSPDAGPGSRAEISPTYSVRIHADAASAWLARHHEGQRSNTVD